MVLSSVISLFLIKQAVAQSVYEDYTFVTLAGSGTAGAGWFDGMGSSARFNTPGGLARDASGNLYVADSGNNTIRKITPDGLVTTFAGLKGSAGSADGRGGLRLRLDPLLAWPWTAAGMFMFLTVLVISSERFHPPA